MANKGPIREFRSGTITAAIWSNEHTHENGSQSSSFSVTIKKRFCDKNGRWQDTTSFFADELPRLRLVAAKAYEFVMLSQSMEDESSDAGPV